MNVEKRQKEGVRDSRGSLSIIINWLAVMTVYDKSLGEESLRGFQTKTTHFLAFKKKHKMVQVGPSPAGTKDI